MTRFLPSISVIAAVLLLAHFCLHQFVIDPGLQAERDAALASVKAERDAHQQTVTDYRLAQAEAAAADAANLARVRAEQQEINHAALSDYRSRLAALRADYQRLRDRRAGEPAAGAAAGFGLPGSSAAAEGTAEAACDHGLSDVERLIASEQALQLDALIDWVEAQAQVEFGQAPAAEQR